ncbi:MAG: glycoside hydrolase family 30 protein [Bradymonadia bacterium]
MRATLTSAAGDAQRVVPIGDLIPHESPEVILRVHPHRERQTIIGIGSSLTQASAVSLSTLSPETRSRVLAMAFASDEAAFSMARTHIASCDFSTHSYTYVPEPDASLESFSLDVDRENGHLDLLLDAHRVKGAQFRLIASPWTAPPWMKDNGRYFDPQARRGGKLLPEHYDTFARYTARYVEAMAQEGVSIWGLTPVNEPHGNGGSWESMEMSANEQAEYVAALGRALEARDLELDVLIYDQNRAGVKAYADGVLNHQDAHAHATGIAVHWYDSTFRVYADQLEAVHAAWPDHPIVQTEGCIDNVFIKGEDKGPGAATPWWRDDSWYWQKVATDWGWDWAPSPEVDHPPYAAAFRYARDIVGGLAHWLSGWIDWNLALTRRGGPNHVENFCLAPILVDEGEIYITPLFHILAQVSRHTRPGAVVLELEGDLPEGLWAVALRNPDGTQIVHLFNETDHPINVSIAWSEREPQVRCPASALLTLTLGTD